MGNDTPTIEQRARQIADKRIKSAKQCAQMDSWIAVLLIALLLFFLTNSLFYLLGGLAIVALSTPTILRIRIMKNFIFKYTGIRTIQMKLDALANYMKVKFVHVPEHYRCEKQD